MSHFAKIENGIVTFVTVGRQEDDGRELEVSQRTGDTYRQTSYNTYGGVHFTDGVPSADQSQAFRKNYAGIGYTFDEVRDAFIAPQPHNKWILNESTCQWEAPVPYPVDGLEYVWNDNKGVWEVLEAPEIEAPIEP